MKNLVSTLTRSRFERNKNGKNVFLYKKAKTFKTFKTFEKKYEMIDEGISQMAAVSISSSKENFIIKKAHVFHIKKIAEKNKGIILCNDYL